MSEPTKLEQALRRLELTIDAWAREGASDTLSHIVTDRISIVIEAAREEAKHPTCASCVSLESDGTCGHHYFLLRTDLVGTVGCNEHKPKEASDEG